MSKYRYKPIFELNQNDDTLAVVERFTLMLLRLDLGYVVPACGHDKITWSREDMKAFIIKMGLDPTRGV